MEPTGTNLRHEQKNKGRNIVEWVRCSSRCRVLSEGIMRKKIKQSKKLYLTIHSWNQWFFFFQIILPLMAYIICLDIKKIYFSSGPDDVRAVSTHWSNKTLRTSICRITPFRSNGNSDAIVRFYREINRATWGKRTVATSVEFRKLLDIFFSGFTRCRPRGMAVSRTRFLSSSEKGLMLT